MFLISSSSFTTTWFARHNECLKEKNKSLIQFLITTKACDVLCKLIQKSFEQRIHLNQVNRWSTRKKNFVLFFDLFRIFKYFMSGEKRIIADRHLRHQTRPNCRYIRDFFRLRSLITSSKAKFITDFCEKQQRFFNSHFILFFGQKSLWQRRIIKLAWRKSGI